MEAKSNIDFVYLSFVFVLENVKRLTCLIPLTQAILSFFKQHYVLPKLFANQAWNPPILSELGTGIDIVSYTSPKIPMAELH